MPSAPRATAGVHALGVVGPDAPDPVLLARLGNLGVHGYRIGGRVDQPRGLRLGDVARPELPLLPSDPPRGGRLPDLGTHLDGHDVNHSSRVDQRGYATGRHSATAHDEDPPALEPQGGGVSRSDGHQSSFRGERQNSAWPDTPLGSGSSSAIPAARVLPSASSTSKKAPVWRRVA